MIPPRFRIEDALLFEHSFVFAERQTFRKTPFDDGDTQARRAVRLAAVHCKSRRGATCKMRLPVKLRLVKLRAQPQSSARFSSGGSGRNAFRLRDMQPATAACWNDLTTQDDTKTGDTREGFDV
jgi:hypothetical protein